MKLSPDQQSVYDAVLNWSGSILTLGGFAGTGKTTVTSMLAKRWMGKKLVAYVAFTGKASSLLARKLAAEGVRTTAKTMLPEGKKLTGRALDICYQADSPEARLPFAGTLHRLLYRPIIRPDTEELVGWEKRTQLDREYDLIVLDEASMVGDEVLLDLKEHGVPILAVGDHGQLPPVKSAGALMREPMLRLEKIHRQAEGNPIIALAQHVREGGLLRNFPVGKILKKTKGDEIEIAYKSEMERVVEEVLCSLDGKGLDCAIISWTNRTRVRLNTTARRVLGFNGPPQRGEIVICLRNSPPVYNGMRGVLTTDSERGRMPWHLNLRAHFPEEGLTAEDVGEITANVAQFNREKTFGSVEELQERGIDVQTMKMGGELYDFGYAATCHKFQGSQARSVVVFLDRPEDPGNEDYRRWMYTAVTRASERLTILR